MAAVASTEAPGSSERSVRTPGETGKENEERERERESFVRAFGLGCLPTHSGPCAEIYPENGPSVDSERRGKKGLALVEKKKCNNKTKKDAG